jgi:hypothetical protein
LRQGNANEEVAIYRYVTEGSFDAYMWQALETKARFIAQVMTGDTTVRSAQDIGGQELSDAEVKAIASGNPAVLTLAEADAELQRLTVLKKNHADEQFLARRSLRHLPETIGELSQRLSDLTADMAAAAHPGDRVTIESRPASRDDATDLLRERLASLPDRVPSPRRVPLGVFGGLGFGVALDPQFPPEVYLEGKTTRLAMLSRDHHGPRAVLNALDRLAGGYGSECARLRQELGIAEGQLRDYEARLGQPFAHEGYLSQLTALRNQLKSGLSGIPSEAGSEPLPAVSELAEGLKALLAAHTLETAPQRDGQRGSSAEEPGTARIRRRAELAS